MSDEWSETDTWPTPPLPAQNATERDFPCCNAPTVTEPANDRERAIWRIRKIEALTRECLDREATEADVRSRLAAAEARVAELETALQKSRDQGAERPNVPSSSPAGEALVQQIAEVIIGQWGTGSKQNALSAARAVVSLVEAQVAPLRARLAAVEALHWPHQADVFTDGTQWCDVEGEDWPCPTIRTLRGEMQVDPHPDIVGALEARAESSERFADLMHDLRWLRARMDDPNARLDFIAHDADQIINKDGRS